MALGVSAIHQRISAENHAREFLSNRQVPALRLQLDRRQPLPPHEGIFPRRTTQRSSSTSTPAAGSPPARRWKRATSTFPAPKASSARCSTATPTSARNSARPAPNTCCPIASVFPRRCPASWRTPACKGFSTQKLSAELAARAQSRRSRFARADARRHPVQRWHLGGPRRRDHHRRAQPGQLQRRHHAPTSARRPAQQAAGRGGRGREQDWVKRVRTRRQSHAASTPIITTSAPATSAERPTKRLGHACWKPWSTKGRRRLPVLIRPRWPRTRRTTTRLRRRPARR